MIDSKLFSFLETLDRQEIHDFSTYLSRNHGKRKVALVLFDYIKTFHPDYQKLQSQEAEFVYHLLFKDNRFSETKMRNALSDLFLWLKKFLLCQKIDRGGLEGDLWWFSILKERNLEKEAARQMVLLKDQANQPGPAGMPFYLYKMLLDYTDQYNFIKKGSPSSSSLQSCIQHLENFYAFTWLKLACEKATRQNLLSPEEQTAQPDYFFSAVPAHIMAQRALHHPSIGVYYEVYQLITTGSNKNYKRAVHLLTTYASGIELEDKIALLVYLQNYMARKIREKGKKFMAHAHALDVFSEKQGVFDSLRSMDHVQYNNIIAAACGLKAFQWAEAFMEKYAFKLDEKIRENTKVLSQATLAFEQKDFSTTIAVLSTRSLREVQDAIRSKCLILKSHYELSATTDETHFLVHFCDAFEQYLNRNKKLKTKGDIVAATMNFIRIVRKLISGKSSKTALTREIKMTRFLYFKEWLLEKAGEYPRRVHHS